MFCFAGCPWHTTSIFYATALACVMSTVSTGDTYSPDAMRDEVHNLPGAPHVSWRMFAGYIDVSHQHEKEGTRQMFYWFVESQRSPVEDPVILWTNGGPGCSGLSGFLTEQGPFRVATDNKTLELNSFAWNNLANMVFIEQPVGVGFSIANRDFQYGDDQAAADNYKFVVGFFNRYPQYRSQDFFISAESYGGHYMPTLAKALSLGGGVSNFRGVMVGNPVTYMKYRNHGHYATGWGHQVIPKPLWDRYEAAGCKDSFPPSNSCDPYVEGTPTYDMDQILLFGDLDYYALDFAHCNTNKAAGRRERWMLYQTIHRAQATHASGHVGIESPYQPCASDYATSYLNRPDVRAAIHVAKSSKWEECSDQVADNYTDNDRNVPMMPLWSWLINHTDLRMMIYSGDDDTICPTIGSQEFIWDLGLKPKIASNWKSWKLGGQIGGFWTDFEVPLASNCTFSFVTVHGAGHMVPATQPSKSLELVKLFLAKSATTIHT